MTTDDWAMRLTARVAEQVRLGRKAADLTVAELAEACKALGLPVAKASLHNLESGRRASVDVSELLVLAEVLGVPPISMLFPMKDAQVEVLPGREVHPWNAVAWFTGEQRAAEMAPKGSSRYLLDTFREHAEAIATALVSTSLARERRQKATIVLDPARRKSLLDAASGYEQLAFDDCRALHELRISMRNEDLIPPDLPAELAFIDQSGPATDGIAE